MGSQHRRSKYFRQPIEVELKPDHSPVTVADRAIETEQRRLNTRGIPVARDSGRRIRCRGRGEWRWVLDPIDGTKSFICGMPLFGALIALMQGDRAVIGIVEPRRAASAGSVSTAGRRASTARLHARAPARDLTGRASTRRSPDSFRGDEGGRTGDEPQGRAATLRRRLLRVRPRRFGALRPRRRGGTEAAPITWRSFRSSRVAGGRITDWEGSPWGSILRIASSRPRPRPCPKRRSTHSPRLREVAASRVRTAVECPRGNAGHRRRMLSCGPRSCV